MKKFYILIAVVFVIAFSFAVAHASGEKPLNCTQIFEDSQVVILACVKK